MNPNNFDTPSDAQEVSSLPDTEAVAPLTKKRGRISFGDGVGTFFFLLSLFFVIYLIAVPMRGVFNSDYADTVTWAKASVDAKALFSKDFTYACLLPFGGQLLMMPFVAIFGYSYTAHACGMIVFFLLFALALSAFFRSIGANRFWVGLLLFCVTGSLCSSEKLREVYFGHILYYSLGGLFLLVGLTLALSLKNDKPDKIQWRLIAFCLWCVLCSTDGLTSLTLFVLPLCTALLFEHLCDKEVHFFSSESFSRSLPVLYAIAASLAGLALGAALRNGFHAPYQEAFSTFSSELDWQANFEKFFPSFLVLFTGPVKMYESFTSFTGIFSALRIVFGLFVLAAPLISLFFWKKLHRGEKLLIVAHFTVCATMLFAFVFGLLSNAEWRLTPMLFTSLLTTVCFVRRLSLLPFWNRFGLLALAFCTLIAGLGFFDVSRLPATAPEGSGADLAHYLELRGYTYGYSDFWDANAITVLSGDKVKCRAVDISEDSGFLSPAYYQSESSWYKGQGNDEKYFLLLSTADYSLAVNSQQFSADLPTDRHRGFVIVNLPADLFPLY